MIKLQLSYLHAAIFSLVVILSGAPQLLYAGDGGEIITFNGNQIEFSDKPTIDTIYAEDPITGEITMMLTQRAPEPIKLNGEKIYTPAELNRQASEGEGSTRRSAATLQTVKTYLLTNMDDFISKLEDGRYYFTMDHIIVDKEGQIVYYNIGGLQHQKSRTIKAEKVSDELAERFKRTAGEVLKNSPKYRAGVFEGRPVNSVLLNGFTLNFDVIDGKLEKL